MTNFIADLTAHLNSINPWIAAICVCAGAFFKFLSEAVANLFGIWFPDEDIHAPLAPTSIEGAPIMVSYEPDVISSWRVGCKDTYIPQASANEQQSFEFYTNHNNMS